MGKVNYGTDAAAGAGPTHHGSHAPQRRSAGTGVLTGPAGASPDRAAERCQRAV
jgi:hypothetical protein